MATIVDFKEKENPLTIRRDIEFVRIGDVFLRVIIEIDENLEPHLQYNRITEDDAVEHVVGNGRFKEID